MAEAQLDKEPSELYITVPDKQGTAVTIFSANGELKTTADFAGALKNHNAGKETPGFIVKPLGSGQETARRGLVTATRETLPNVGETIGGVAALSPLLVLAAKAGLISPGTANAPVQAGKAAGRAVGDFIGQQVDTPGELGLAAGTGLATRAALPVVGASSELLKTNLLKNIIGTGLTGVAGSTAAKAAFGEDQTFVQGAQEFASAALANGLQGVTSYWLTRMLKPDTATKVATEMMDAIKKKYPTLINDPEAFNIGNASPRDISNLTSMMSKALRGDAADEATALVDNIKGRLLHRATVGEQNTLRMHARRIIEAQNKALDNIGDDVAYNEAIPVIQQRKEELLQAVRDMYPNVKKIDPTLIRVQEELLKHDDYGKTFIEGATVLHHLKMSGAREKFDPMAFAQRIRGVYTEDQGSLLKRVGEILGQGQSLKDLPLPNQPQPPPSTGMLKATNIRDFLKGLIPGADMMSRAMRTNSTPTPWGIPGTTAYQPQLQTGLQGLMEQTGNVVTSKTANFAAQEAGQSAIRSFLNTKEE